MQLTDKIEKIRKKSNYLTIWRKKQFTNEKKCSILRKTRNKGWTREQLLSSKDLTEKGMRI